MKNIKCDNCGDKAIGQIQGLGYCADISCIDIVVGKALTPLKTFTEMFRDA